MEMPSRWTKLIFTDINESVSFHGECGLERYEYGISYILRFMMVAMQRV